MTDVHNESPDARIARAKGQALVAQMRAAAREGRLKVGVRDIEPTPDETFDDLELAGQQYEKSIARGESTVPITIRMDPHMIEALRVRAEQLGVRGYQTLIKQWINDLLTHAPMINVEHLAAMPLGKVAHVVESAKAPGLGMGLKRGMGEPKGAGIANVKARSAGSASRRTGPKP